MSKSKSLALKNNRGQMAVFVALIFQVLFLFFAMGINLALVVHDKINLQNSVDLAAYYAGQKQAELLNVIAHNNYQIRQAWKLFIWRMHVLGTMGIENPEHPTQGGSATEAIYPAANYPMICVAYRPTWKSAGADDNFCKSQVIKIKNIEPPSVVASFLPFNVAVANYINRVRDTIATTCATRGAANWFYAASIYTAFMLDQQNRKEVIRALAKAMTVNGDDMLDLDGESIGAGAQKTFEKNLTASNRRAREEFTVINGLQGRRQEDWLPEINIWFTARYVDIQGSTSGCNSVEGGESIEVPHPAIASLGAFGFNSDLTDGLIQKVKEGHTIALESTTKLSLGVEKNPWQLAYVGIRARTRPRQLFFPFGAPVKFVAEAYAQPFGGRIGPWYGQQWAKGAESSSGNKVDFVGPEKIQAGGIMNTTDANVLIPNTSRFPGDTLGYRAGTTLNGIAGIAERAITHVEDYGHFLTTEGRGKSNDFLGFAPRGDHNIRYFEVAAIAPDLYDLAYYSIQPNYGEYYLPRLQKSRDRLGIPDNVWPHGDLGSLDDVDSGEFSRNFSVRDQMRIASTGGTVNLGNLWSPTAFWFVRAEQHLLTSWVHNNIYGDYFSFPDKRFAKCEEFDNDYKVKAPGGCMGPGGRTGYSVKIINSDIFKTPLKLGGPGTAPDTILNPAASNEG